MQRLEFDVKTLQVSCNKLEYCAYSVGVQIIARNGQEKSYTIKCLKAPHFHTTKGDQIGTDYVGKYKTMWRLNSSVQND